MKAPKDWRTGPISRPAPLQRLAIQQNLCLSRTVKKAAPDDQNGFPCGNPPFNVLATLSASTAPLASRPAGSKILAGAKKGKAVVIVAKLDRLLRSVAYAAALPLN
jgi:hypothetical protein